MAQTYNYKARDQAGQLLAGTILADSEAAVAAHIRERGFFVTEIKPEAKPGSINTFLKKLQSVKIKELAIMCRQFSTMVDAGLPLITCLSTLIDQTESKLLKSALQDVYKKVKEGETLSRALSDHPNIFPGIMINMTEAGEIGGVLDTVLARLAAHFEKEHKLNEKVKSAMTYPVVVISMATLAVVFIITFVLPTFMQMFTNMNVELPLPTKILIGLSFILKTYWPTIIIGLSVVVYALIFAYKQEKVKQYVDDIILQLPVFGVLNRKIAIARFSRTLSTLIKGGVPIITGLEVVKKTIGYSNMIHAMNLAQANIKEGLALATTLNSSKVFTPMVIQMVSIGEESGSLDNMLEKVADFYESDIDDMISRLSSLMEPVIIGILGVVIGFIVLSVMLPLFDVISNVG